MTLESNFDSTFTASLALREKQIQQSYRPVIGVHKWFARRPGTLFRNLLLAEFNGTESPEQSYFRAHNLEGVIADPFMGGGTPLIEANRLGFNVIGSDINPMAWWIVRQELGPFDDAAFAAAAEQVVNDVAAEVSALYETDCLSCGSTAAVKYFIWVKEEPCPKCGLLNDLFPGYLLAEAGRHPFNVVACWQCGALVETEVVPHAEHASPCPTCGAGVRVEGPAHRNRVDCRGCGTPYRYPAVEPVVPRHRLWAIEYHCARCKPTHTGRSYKVPDRADLARYADATTHLKRTLGLPIPAAAIPAGDETDRLHRWGYRYYRDMFNDRQLLGLGLLHRALLHLPDGPIRHALLTVFSDILRYQNMLCRYDTGALKCQDIFSVHGFPVGLVQCENNLLGIPGVGGGGFRHFVAKYRRAKAYCAQPFETRQVGRRKQIVRIEGERIEAAFSERLPSVAGRQAWLVAGSAADLDLPPATLDGVFTDPPYFANVQYAELMDFCYVWLRQGLNLEFREFQPTTTRSPRELTGNATMGRGLEHFTEGLSRVFCRFSTALKPNAPFVFTYHHNDLDAYVPLVVSILDAGLVCTSVLPAPAEMSASLHINNTGSSIVDSVFVARVLRGEFPEAPSATALERALVDQVRALEDGGVRVTLGDVLCLSSGLVARVGMLRLREEWDSSAGLSDRMDRASATLRAVATEYELREVATRALKDAQSARKIRMITASNQELVQLPMGGKSVRAASV